MRLKKYYLVKCAGCGRQIRWNRAVHDGCPYCGGKIGTYKGRSVALKYACIPGQKVGRAGGGA